MMQRVLFVCSKNKLRSPTAEGIFSMLSDIEVDSAGTCSDALNRLTIENVSWATHIVCMENEHAQYLRHQFKSSLRAKIIVLDIEDDYDYMEDALIWKLTKTMNRWYKGSCQLSA